MVERSSRRPILTRARWRKGRGSSRSFLLLSSACSSRLATGTPLALLIRGSSDTVRYAIPLVSNRTSQDTDVSPERESERSLGRSRVDFEFFFSLSCEIISLKAVCTFAKERRRRNDCPTRPVYTFLLLPLSPSRSHPIRTPSRSLVGRTGGWRHACARK